MSQSGSLQVSSLVVPPNVATAYVANSGTAVPSANILNVLGTGDISTTGAGNTITVSDIYVTYKSAVIDMTVGGLTKLFTTLPNQSIGSRYGYYVVNELNKNGDGFFSIGAAASYTNLIPTDGLRMQSPSTGYYNYGSFGTPNPAPYAGFIPPSTDIYIDITTPDSGTTLQAIFIIQMLYITIP